MQCVAEGSWTSLRQAFLRGKVSGSTFTGVGSQSRVPLRGSVNASTILKSPGNQLVYTLFPKYPSRSYFTYRQGIAYLGTWILKVLQ